MAGIRKNEASSSSKSIDNNGGFGGGVSKVADCGRNRSSCGYCKSPGRTSVSHGLRAHSLTVNDYQDLLDRGWRRSGSFLYKPDMKKTCCPSYTIRLRAGDFVPSKDQLRVTRRFQRFLDGNLDSNRPLKLKEDSSVSKQTFSSIGAGSSTSDVKENDTAERTLQSLSDKINFVVHTCVENGELPNDLQFPKASVKKVSQGKRKLYNEGSETLLYSCNVAFQIAAAVKNQRESEVEKEFSPKTIAEKLASSLNQLPEIYGLLVKACNGHINFYSGADQVSFEAIPKIATLSEDSSGRRVSEVSGHSGRRVSEMIGHSPVKKRQLEIHLKRSSFDPQEYALYRRYQIKVHNDIPDRVTESSYKRFLVDTPLIFVPPTRDGKVPPSGFGSFHQQYVVDGQLVAVGVIDILPKCLSSKYLFWDPDFAFLSLGKYSALQEVDWVKENQFHCPSLQFYYLGYYIHSCNKMRYKAAYHPSELLCPLRYQWVRFDVAKPFLDRKRYVVLSDCGITKDGESSALPNASECFMELGHDDTGIDHSDNVHMHQSEETGSDHEYESSDDESGGEFSDPESSPTENGDLSNVLIGLNGKSLKYRELQRAFRPSQQTYLESLLHRYLKVVGKGLSERMIYSLG